MKCSVCGAVERRNRWICKVCGRATEGGVVFVTGISGSGVDKYLSKVVEEAQEQGHNHKVQVHDIGHIMQECALLDDPHVGWGNILNADKSVLRHLRARAFDRLRRSILDSPEVLHIVDIHLSFKWFSYLTPGFDFRLFIDLAPYTRCFVNIVEDLSKVQDNLRKTTWGERSIEELLNWRDVERFLTEIFTEFLGHVDYYRISAGEPPETLERLIWHPEMKRVYLSFPITNIIGDTASMNEIEAFRDNLRAFLVVFDPRSSRDYDDVNSRIDMGALKREIAEVVVEKDYRLIDQSDAVVVYYPRRVSSKGVDAEMNYARRTGKPIYVYCPEELGGGPFAVPVTRFFKDVQEFLAFISSSLSSTSEPS
jgi:adenylate kinase